MSDKKQLVVVLQDIIVRAAYSLKLNSAQICNDMAYCRNSVGELDLDDTDITSRKCKSINLEFDEEPVFSDSEEEREYTSNILKRYIPKPCAIASNKREAGIQCDLISPQDSMERNEMVLDILRKCENIDTDHVSDDVRELVYLCKQLKSKSSEMLITREQNRGQNETRKLVKSRKISHNNNTCDDLHSEYLTSNCDKLNNGTINVTRSHVKYPLKKLNKTNSIINNGGFVRRSRRMKKKKFFNGFNIFIRTTNDERANSGRDKREAYYIRIKSQLPSKTIKSLARNWMNSKKNPFGNKLSAKEEMQESSSFRKSRTLYSPDKWLHELEMTYVD